MSKIEIRNLYLIFGKEKHKAEKMLKEGKTIFQTWGKFVEK